MGFVLGTFAILLFLVGVLVLIGLLSERESRELLDWKPTRSPELEAQNEIDDVRQMLEAQNEMRRRRGAPEIDEARLRDEVEREELERLRRGESFGSS
ncbi:MAG TPA: hypothetical protein VFZ41_00465 [Solirubrobacterales bacterium]